MITGTCHCGAIQFEAGEKIIRTAHCHCDDCRRISGATYNTALVVDAQHFRITRGEDALSSYESSPGKFRCFCKICSAPIHAYMTFKPGIVILRAGLIDNASLIHPDMHIWIKAKAPWHEITDDLPQHLEGAPAK